MEEETQLMDQAQLAESVEKKIRYEMTRLFLVKPLDPIMVKKEFTNPVSDKPAEKDENGVEAVDYEKTETEIKEVESDYRKGVVLKVPHEHTANIVNYSDSSDMKMPYIMDIKVGDIVVYANRSAKWFDLLKDTQLVSSYDILAVERTNDN